MSDQFKPGDMALLINAGAKNDFKTVELLEFLGSPGRIPFGDIHLVNPDFHRIWRVRSCRDPIVFSKYIQENSGVTSSMESPAAEHNLIPLRGDFAPVQLRVVELTT